MDEEKKKLTDKMAAEDPLKKAEETKEPDTARTSATPYDDVFRTLLNDCKQLLLPVLNEIFGEHYTGTERIVYSQNEHFINRQGGVEEKRITDSGFTVIGKETKSYLFECQTRPDSSILVRIFEYEAQIALDGSEIVGDTLEVTIPNSAILYLRSSKNTPDRMKIKINTPGGSVAFDVLTMKIREYSLEEIFDKNLLLLIPFYIFNYGSKKQLEELENNSEKLDALKKECALIVERLDDLTDREELSVYYRQVLLEMSNKVVESLAARYEKVVKGVKDVMGGTVLEYKAKDIFIDGILTEKKEVVHNMHDDGMAPDKIAKYVNVSIETVKQWLGLQKAETLTEN